MERKRLENGKTHVIKKGGEEVSANQFGAGVKPADVMWVKIHGGSWWPAQVVDEDTISACNTPSNKSAGEVLVRLYGSYTYLYVDPVKSLDEFDKILKQNNGSYREIFLKALEQEVPCSKDGKSKRQGSKSKANVCVDASSCKSSHSYDKENQEVDASDFVSSHSKRQPNTVILQTEVKKRKLLSRRGKEENNKASKPRGVKSDIASGKKEVKRKLLSRRGKEENNKASKPRGVKSDIASGKKEVKRKLLSRRGKEENNKASKPRGVKSDIASGKKEVKRKSSMQDQSPKKVKISSSAKNDKGKSSKQGGVLKNSKLRGSNNQAEGRSRALKHDVLQKKRKLDDIRPAEKSRSKTSRQKVLKNSKQDELHKNVKPNGARNVSGRRQNDKQNDVRKKRKPNDSSIEDGERKRTPKHDKMLKQHKEKTSVAESQEPSARRLRVMQSLGLIAPPGSPFLKNGHIAPVS